MFFRILIDVFNKYHERKPGEWMRKKVPQKELEETVISLV